MPITHRFTARGSDGCDYRLIRSVREIPTTPLDEVGGRTTLEDLPDFFTDTGKRVVRLAQGRYQINGTDIVLTSSDPNAP